MQSLLMLLATVLAANDSPAEPRPTSPPPLRPVVEVEEDVYTYAPANNGAGPLWCSGSTCLVRIGDQVFASGLETLKDAEPLNNCRWTLYQRAAGAWQLQQADAVGRTREPCPLATLPGGRLLLSANPSVAAVNAYSGPSRPEVLQFAAKDPKARFVRILPAWEGQPAFTEHSYRSFAADAASGSLILFQNIGYTHAEWSLLVGQVSNLSKNDSPVGQVSNLSRNDSRESNLRSVAKGKLTWPRGAEYDKPQPIRVCYPNVAIHGREVHFCGVSDIVEPYQKWREYKRKLTGVEWDYDFRRLFYTWSDDVATGKFHPWVEIASRDKTCGWISPGDLWMAPDGSIRILYTERAIDERLRTDFFPNEKQSHSLQYVVVRAGKVVSRRALLKTEEGGPHEVPGAAAFTSRPMAGCWPSTMSRARTLRGNQSRRIA